MKFEYRFLRMAPWLICAFLAAGVLAQEETAAPKTAGSKAAAKENETTTAETGENPLRAAADVEAETNDPEEPTDDDEKPAGVTSSPEAAASKADFDKRFADWKMAIREIDALRIKYQIADEPTRKQLQEQLQDQFDTASEMIPSLIDAARTAFDTAPKADQAITDLLMSVTAHFVTTDRYEDAQPIISSLLSGGVDEDWLYVWGTIAAVALANYEQAEDHLAELKGSELFSAPPESENKFESALWSTAKNFAEIFDQHREDWGNEQEIRAAEAEADDLPRILLKTNKGDITVELFENEAPIAVKNFVSLVEDGFYDGLTFHRVLANFMAQAGCPTGDGKGGPGHHIPCECYEPDARTHFRGTLSMAHAGRDSGRSQFFITFLPTPQLDGRHTAFGRVIDGMEVLAKIKRRDPSSQQPLPEPDQIIEAKILRKRPDTDYADYKKLPGR